MKILCVVILLISQMSYGIIEDINEQDTSAIMKTGNEAQEGVLFQKQRKNVFAIDMLVSNGMLIGLNYERLLTNLVSVELGIAPTFLNTQGIVVPIGLNLIFPYGSNHRVGATAKLLFYSGEDLTSSESESKNITSIVLKNGPLTLYGLFYQYNSNYFLTYRLGIDVVDIYPSRGTGHGYAAIGFNIGYNF